MRVVRYLAADGPRIGLLRQDQSVVDLLAAAETRQLNWLRPFFTDLRAFVLGGANLREVADDLARHERRSMSLDEIQISRSPSVATHT